MMNGTQSGGAAGFGWGLVLIGLVIAGIGLIWVIAPHARGSAACQEIS